MKAVLFATGSLSFAAAEANRLRQRPDCDTVYVVADPGEAAELATCLQGAAILNGGIASIFRLWMLLGFASTEVFCISDSAFQRRAYRLMKLLAYALRGHVVFVRPDGSAPIGFWSFVSFAITRMRGNRALLVGSASPETLQLLAADLQKRRPEEVVEILPPSLGAYFRALRNCKQYRYLSIPWTGEGHSILKLFALFLPCGRREIYNEAGDSFSIRLIGTVFAHIGNRIRLMVWRAGDGIVALWNGIRYARWWMGDRLLTLWNGIRYARWWIGDRLLAIWYKLIALPPGVTVVGSASGYYLRDIVADCRRKHPGEPVYGLLPSRLVAPAGPLFDAVIPFEPMAILRHCFGATRTGYCAIPCTNEGYNRYKLLGFALPLGQRKIYNENADGYPVRVLRTLITHVFWRLRHRLFYQAFTQRRGRSWFVVWFNLLLYPFRLIAGAWVLFSIRLRAKYAPIPVVAKPVVAEPAQPASPVLDPAER